MATNHTLRLTFLTDAGIDYSVSISNASSALLTDSTPVTTLANYMITNTAILPQTLISLKSAVFTETTTTDISTNVTNSAAYVNNPAFEAAVSDAQAAKSGATTYQQPARFGAPRR